MTNYASKSIQAHCFALALLAATGAARAASETVVYSFKGGSDGFNPVAGLTDVNGTLYGTTWAGGGPLGCCGTVFSVTTAGTESVIYHFKGGKDGGTPYASLLNVGGTLYGTTAAGGASGNGTVFRVTTAGAEKVIHSFEGGSDGTFPTDGLNKVGPNLYGITDSGTLFSVSPSGVETPVPAVGSVSTASSGNLLDVGGTLYGTTSGGPKNGWGTVFSVTTSGVGTLLYSFKGHGRGDGANPYGSLTYLNGKLYGTTQAGGTSNYGTVFCLVAPGFARVVYSFKGGSDGASPLPGLVDVNGTLYGTTLFGGAAGHGTVFSVTPSGNEAVLHSFSTGSYGDAYQPNAGLINVNGTLYGTSTRGGVYGVGTVFSVTP